MDVRRKFRRRATIGALVLGLSTPVAAVAAAGSAVPFSLPLQLLGTTPVVHVTQQDAGKTIDVSRGTLIQVDLHGSYDPPSVDHPEVLQEGDHTGGYPTGSDAHAVFTAVGGGSATISSRMDVACQHTNPRCMIMFAPMRVNIVVDGAGATSSPNPTELGTAGWVGTLLKGNSHQTAPF
ncbi:MAG TPA: hypothetical protein VHV82_10175 [Sporichthyaceae bacterium]|jgi:hypothetical protein|nr:hypothetical protein [Sporichthyaceae bacterium]